jgi:hypothetical protein
VERYDLGKDPPEGAALELPLHEVRRQDGDAGPRGDPLPDRLDAAEANDAAELETIPAARRVAPVTEERQFGRGVEEGVRPGVLLALEWRLLQSSAVARRR